MLYLDQLFSSPVLCMNCAKLNSRAEALSSICVECNATLDQRIHDDMFRYAFYAARYGYQYRNYYERSNNGHPTGKPMLGSLDPIFTFIGIAAISGIIGGAAHDLVKHAITRILAQQRDGQNSENIIEWTESDIERYIEDISDYHKDLRGIQETIRNDLVEEMLGDAAAENPRISRQLTKIMARSTITKRDKKKAAKLYMRLASEISRKTKRIPRVPPGAEAWKGLK
jgi:hypothetical protein